ncbi:MAG: phage holin family protein [Candidatus Nealsonbacteria bacterium]|nr:phage holin family protein [Candidatus Nealsonbacteria bacterium]
MILHTLVLQIISGVVGIWISQRYVEGVEFTGTFQQLIAAGAMLGIVNTFIKPAIKMVTFPLRLITLGLFTIVVNMAMVWIVDVFFKDLIISGIIPLFWATIIIWALSVVISIFGKGKV